MRALASTCLVLAVALCASTAHAARITNLTVEIDASDAVVRVDSDAALRRPRVRIEDGAVRLWFPGLGQDYFVERQGDGHALRRVTARPGAAATTLVILDLGDARHLAPADVRVELDGPHAVVRIARSVLPIVAREPVVAPTQPAAAQPAVAAVVAAPTPVADPAADPVAPVGASAAAPAAAEPTAEPAAAPPTAAPDASPFAARQAGPAEAPLPPSSLNGFAGAIPDAKNAGMRTIGLVVLLLAGLALFGRWLKQKRATRPAAAIRIVASHRLGAKHQLVVVRAFDQEILLSVNGNETRRIASRRADSEPASAPGTGGLELIASSASAAGRLLALVPAAVPERGPSRHDAGAPEDVDPSSHFGAEFARLVRGVSAPAPASRPLVSDSVSGLVRLREARGQQ